jgi:hypothetical protein
MWHFRSKACSDPRDKAYSLLYFSNDATNLKVNYRISTTQLALDLLQGWADPFCLCLMKLLWRSLQVDNESLSDNDVEAPDKRYLEYKAYDIGNADDCGHCEESLNVKGIDDLPHTEQIWLCCLSCRHQVGWWSRHGHFIVTVPPTSTLCVYFLQGGHSTRGWTKLSEELHNIDILSIGKTYELDEHGGLIEMLVFHMPLSTIWRFIRQAKPEVCVDRHHSNKIRRQVLRTDKPYVPWQPWKHKPALRSSRHLAVVQRHARSDAIDFGARSPEYLNSVRVRALGTRKIVKP